MEDERFISVTSCSRAQDQVSILYRWRTHPEGMHTTCQAFADILIFLFKIGQMDESWKVVDIMGTRDRPVSLVFALGNSWESSLTLKDVGGEHMESNAL